MIIAATALVLAPNVAAETLMLEMEKQGNEISLTDYEVLEGEPPNSVEEPEEGYRLKLFKNGEVVHRKTIKFYEKIRAPQPEWFDGSEQVKVPESDAEKITTKIVKLPLKDAEKVQVEDRNGNIEFNEEIGQQNETERSLNPNLEFIAVGILAIILVTGLILWKRNS